MPDVSSNATVETTQTYLALDVHKRSIVAGALPASGGEVELTEIPNTERAVRRLVDRYGGPDGLAVCYEAGPCGYAPYRLLSRMGVACDVVAPTLVPVRAGDRVKTDRRDARKLCRLYRAGELAFVAPPTPAQEGLRDLTRCLDDLISARRAARHRISKQLLRHGRIHPGKKSWTKAHRAWVATQRLDDPLADEALCEMRAHLDSLDAQIATLEHRLEEIARSEPWSDPARWLMAFRGIATKTALGLLAEIGDFRRFSSPRELMSYLGLTPSEYSSGEQRHRGHITKSGNRQARRLVVEAAWHYRRRPSLTKRQRELAALVPAEVPARAWRAQLRLRHRHSVLERQGKRPTVANVAVARELTGFIWAAMTHQPLREEVSAT
jgi:transposase